MTKRLQHGVASQVWTFVKYGPNHTMALPFEHNRYHTFGHVYNRSGPLCTTLSANFITCLGIARTVLSQLFAFLWPISKFGICIKHSAASTMVARKINSRWRVFVCSQVHSIAVHSVAVHSVALRTRVTLGLGMCKVCTEAVRCVAL